MNRMQRQVEEFHREFGHVIGTTPGFSRRELRAGLIHEEACETTDAIAAGDFTAAVDGLCDLLYVTIGTAVEFGIDIEPIFDEVHRSNMAKKGGGKSPEGKSLKPPGWTPPDVAGEINRQRMRKCFVPGCEEPPHALYNGTPKCGEHCRIDPDDLPLTRE